MKFDPRDAELIADDSQVTFEVVKVHDVPPSDGKNGYLRINLNCETDTGHSKNITATIFNAGMMKKFCSSIGILEQFLTGEVKEFHCKGKYGKAIVKIEVDESGRWPDKNVISKFIEADHQEKTKPVDKKSAEKKPDFDDDIPF